jgi:hypothetical protein
MNMATQESIYNPSDSDSGTMEPCWMTSFEFIHVLIEHSVDAHRNITFNSQYSTLYIGIQTTLQGRNKKGLQLTVTIGSRTPTLLKFEFRNCLRCRRHFIVYHL